MRKNSALDEMQELELLKIEHNGCWIAFWGLLIALAVQSAVFGNTDFRTLAGEWVVFMVLAVYLAVACMRRGIWDRRIPMNTRSNLTLSAAAAAALGGLIAITVFRSCRKLSVTAAAALITASVTFALCFTALTLAMKKTAKRIRQLEEEPSDADER